MRSLGYERVISAPDLGVRADEIVEEIAEGAEPVLVEIDGEVMAVLQSAADYRRIQERLAALSRLLAGGPDTA